MLQKRLDIALQNLERKTLQFIVRIIGTLDIVKLPPAGDEICGGLERLPIR